MFKKQERVLTRYKTRFSEVVTVFVVVCLRVCLFVCFCWQWFVSIYIACTLHVHGT